MEKSNNESLTLIFPFTNEHGEQTGVGAHLTYPFQKSVYVYSPTLPYDKDAVLEQIQTHGVKAYCVDTLTKKQCKLAHAALMFGSEKYVLLGYDKPFHYTNVGGCCGVEGNRTNYALRHLISGIGHIRLDSENIYTTTTSRRRECYQANLESFHYELIYKDLKPYGDFTSCLPKFTVKYVICKTSDS